MSNHDNETSTFVFMKSKKKKISYGSLNERVDLSIYEKWSSIIT